ncbi:MAG: AAA family ATPase [Bdellovibrionales bacterium]|nr:AAA family ATPase [Bdellovibrionales bacterium]
MIQRHAKLSQSHSFFLFGPRGVGKSTLLNAYFKSSETLFIDLLDLSLMDSLLLDISRFEALINSQEHRNKRVVIDEIQKLPRLLDIVHSQIHKSKRQFVLTGSSARRLKQQGTNLLAGRAWTFNLYPFTMEELGSQFDLKRALEFGCLPEAYLGKDFLKRKNTCPPMLELI